MPLRVVDVETSSAPAPSPSVHTLARAPDLDDVKRSFLRMVSHELRTPLNSVLGFPKSSAGSCMALSAIPATRPMPR